MPSSRCCAVCTVCLSRCHHHMIAVARHQPEGSPAVQAVLAPPSKILNVWPALRSRSTRKMPIAAPQQQQQQKAMA